MQRVVHITTYASSGGGMQSLVRRHRLRDASLGFKPEVVAILEKSAPDVCDVGLEVDGGCSLRTLRQRFITHAHSRTAGAVVIYHNAWALPLLAPGDGALRRLAFLHFSHRTRAWLETIEPWCDHLLCVSSKLSEALSGRVNASWLPAPVEAPADLSPAAHTGGAARIGYVGRLERTEKRVDRLPALIEAVGGGVTWSVVGDGPERSWLERATRGRGAVFHGWLERDAYWRELRRLDVIAFTSDAEGTPLSLLEGLSCGAIPLYPAVGGDGEALARRVDSRCVFPPGDIPTAAAQLRALLADDRVSLRARARAVVADRTPAKYEEAYAEALHRTVSGDRSSRAEKLRPQRWSDLLPLAVVGRFYERALWR